MSAAGFLLFARPSPTATLQCLVECYEAPEHCMIGGDCNEELTTLFDPTDDIAPIVDAPNSVGLPPTQSFNH
jgi:hypothetical protein